MSESARPTNSRAAEERRLREGARWLAVGAVVVLMALITWGILSAANGSGAGMVASSSGSVAVALAWTTGHAAIAKRRQQLAESTGGGDKDQAGTA